MLNLLCVIFFRLL